MKIMTRKERTQQNRFGRKIAPLMSELKALCEKFKMPMVTSVQLYQNEETGFRMETFAAHQNEMSVPMALCVGLLDGPDAEFEFESLEIIDRVPAFPFLLPGNGIIH